MSESLTWLIRIVGTILIVAGLHAAREFLVPCSIAVLLALALAPVTRALEGRGLGRLGSVLLSVVAATALIGGIGWMLTRQLADVAGHLPEYRQNVTAKVPALGPFGALIEKGYDLLEAASADISKPASRPPSSGASGAIDMLGDALLSILNTLGTGFIILLLVVFILKYRDDLRDRLVQLLGAGRVRVSTRAMDDAAGSVSRYLLMQSLVNLAYGIVVTLMLVGLGIPNALLWGLLAAVSRFIPYFGPWLGAALPLFLSLTAFPGWGRFFILAASWVCLELTVANAIEPVLYGRKSGLSPLAVLLAAVFWTWIWGGPGLLLSIPLTVSLVVLGKHFQPLRFLHTMLADDASLDPRLQLYQRLLARDLPAAEDLGDLFIQEHGLVDVYDGLLVPTLCLASEDRQSGLLEDQQADRVLNGLSVLFDDLSDRAPAASPPPIVTASAWGHLTLCIPTADAADDLGARMIERVLASRQVSVDRLPFKETVGEKVRLAADRLPDLVIVVSIRPSPLIPVRYLYKKLRAALPKTEILVVLLDAPGEPGRWSERILGHGGPRVATSVKAMEQAVGQVLPPLVVRKAAALAELPGPARP